MAFRNAVLIACAGLALSTFAVRAQDMKPVKAQPVQPGHEGHDHAAAPSQPILVKKAEPMPEGAMAQPTAVVSADSPKLTFDEMSHDFGVITDDNSVTTKFKFSNVGKSNLVIGNVQGSCGCTVPALEKKEYAPGEGGEISVTYNPHNRRGKQQTNVTVNSNDPAAPSMVLQLHSEIKPMMFFEPQLVNFQQVPKANPTSVSFTITSRRDDLKPTQATTSNPAMQARMLESKEVEIDGEKMFVTPVEVSIVPGAEVGPLNGQITVRTTDPARLLNVAVMGEVIGDMAVSPARLQFANLKPGGPVSNSAHVTSRSGAPFKIIAAEEVPMGAKLFSEITFVQEAGSNPPAWVITASGNAPTTPTAIRGDILVTTDSDEEKTFKIPYNGYIAQQTMPQAQYNNPTGAPIDPWVSNPSSLVPGK